MSVSVANSRYDVAIVGLGPVGAVFANLLAKDGLRVAIVERAAAIYDKPRAITLDHEALRVFQAIGLGGFMEQAIAPHNGSHYLGVDGEIIKIFDPMPPPFPLGWTPNVTFVQPEAEQALRSGGTGEASLRRVGEAAAEEAELISDGQGSAAYKKQLVRVYVARALRAALAQNGGSR